MDLPPDAGDTTVEEFNPPGGCRYSLFILVPIGAHDDVVPRPATLIRDTASAAIETTIRLAMLPLRGLTQARPENRLAFVTG